MWSTRTIYLFRTLRPRDERVCLPSSRAISPPYSFDCLILASSAALYHLIQVKDASTGANIQAIIRTIIESNSGEPPVGSLLYLVFMFLYS